MRVNELFYSVQGEGRYTGNPAIFVRFSGCNLACPFCDTDFHSYQEMTEAEIAAAVQSLSATGCRRVVLTGGEPTMQVNETLLRLLHDQHLFVSVETNGAYRDANELPFDFITLSPKDWYVGRDILKTYRAGEVKMVMDDKVPESVFKEAEQKIEAKYYYVQPCDTGDTDRNCVICQRVFRFVKANPKWNISLQTQKILNVR